MNSCRTDSTYAFELDYPEESLQGDLEDDTTVPEQTFEDSRLSVTKCIGVAVGIIVAVLVVCVLIALRRRSKSRSTFENHMISGEQLDVSDCSRM